MRNILCLLVSLAASQAAAQDNAWSYSATLYGWFPGTKVDVGTPVGSVEGEVSASDALQELDFAFMGAFTAQRGRLGLIGDLIYFDLQDENATPGPLFSDAKVESQITITNAYLTYEVFGNDANRVDLGVGARFYNVDTDVTLSEGAAPEAEFTGGDDWIDPLIAVRYRGRFAENWFGTAMLDTGGFIGSGSDFTWQGLATIGYRFNDRFSMQAGYRYLESNRDDEDDGTEIDIEMSGPVVGVSYTF